jgi:hypothetical protein
MTVAVDACGGITRTMNSPADSLAVEVFLQGMVVRGHSNDAVGRRRLLDVLNAPEEHIELSEATVKSLASGESMEFPTIAIQKRSIIAAIPRETAGQDHQRQMANLGGRVETLQIGVTIAAPPYVISGTAHAIHGSRAPKVPSASSVLFTRFFSVTDATITDSEGQPTEASILLVNREMIATTARHPDKAR